MDNKLDNAVNVFIPLTILLGIRYAIKKINGKIVVHHSLTPNEAEELLFTMYVSHLDDFMTALFLLNKTGTPLEEKAKEKILEYAKKNGMNESEAKAYVDRIVEMVKSGNKMDSYKEMLKLFSKHVTPPPSVLFIGPPGVGKSETVRRVSERIASKYGLIFIDYTGVTSISYDIVERIHSEPWNYFVFVDLRLSSVEPSDLMGIPDVTSNRHYTTYKPFLWSETLSIAPGLLFLDEFTNVTRKDVLSASYQLILDRRSGFTRLNPAVMITLAGNPPEYATGIATALPQPLVDRMEIYNFKPPTYWEWKNYMEKYYGNNWIKDVYTLILILSTKNDDPSGYIIVPKSKKIIHPEEKTATPRSYTRLAVELYKFLGKYYKDPNIAFTKICVDMVNAGRTCEYYRNINTDPNTNLDEYIKKMVCEKIVGNIGRALSELLIIIGSTAITESPLEIASKPPEEIVKYINSKVEELLRKTAEIGVKNA